MNARVNVSTCLLPFNQVIYSTTGMEKQNKKENVGTPVYTTPQTTSHQDIQIVFEGNESYSVPKTTV